MTTIAPFDVADYLESNEDMALYLTACLEHNDPDLFLSAVSDVARARGMTHIARATGLGRESLYKALSPGAKPRYDTVLRIVAALGLRLQAVPAPATNPAAGSIKRNGTRRRVAARST